MCRNNWIEYCIIHAIAMLILNKIGDYFLENSIVNEF